jgi:hypothetical protein
MLTFGFIGIGNQLERITGIEKRRKQLSDNGPQEIQIITSIKMN